KPAAVARSGLAAASLRPRRAGRPETQPPRGVGREAGWSAAASGSGSALGAGAKPVRGALGGTGSLRLHRAEDVNSSESRWLGAATRDTITDWLRHAR
ncbi:MAG: hypothetical protein ACK52I_35450, partial [Pseudomonadota bacterium]